MSQPATIPNEPTGRKSPDLARLTVEDVQAGFASRAYTAQSLIEASLGRVERYNTKYNAIIFLNPSAVDEAKEIDRRRTAGEHLGPLAGIPVVVKDTIDIAGFPTTAGWSLLYSKTGGADLLPEHDAPVVARLREAGAVIIGKTNVPILSSSGTHANNSWAGPTRNVVVPDRAPGGSSSGTASAVASGMVVLGLAEETGGSIQNPAAAQDLVGIKPTVGLVSNAGVFPLSANRDVVGPLARCVRDAAICLDVLAGYTSEDPKTLAGVGKKPREGYISKLRVDALKGKRLALYGSGWRKRSLSTEAQQLYDRAKQELEGLGAVLIEDPFSGSGFADLCKPTSPFANIDAHGLESVPYDLDKYLGRLGPKAALKTFAEFAKATKKENPFGPEGVLNYVNNLPQFAAILANPSQPPNVSEFIALKMECLTIFEEVFARHHLDACVFPQMLQELPPLHGKERILASTVDQINIAGLPGITVPAGYYASGSPFSLIFVGRMWSEAELLAYAYAYESITRHRKIPALEMEGAASADGYS
ncbi:amidase [Bradyrhizobium sp. 179]|uniref:amidase n=1 Tax=Bradyrhizobium sp. 179 TaxID=2782648 RepID=UPI001FF76432|nr:amidase [Bradyrhizobium sp. 179]MCK1540541.1 amidase [Bradyrhizobium sp. 179]